MGITHGDAGNWISRTGYRQSAIDNLSIGVDGNLSSLENRLPHVHFDGCTDDLGANDAGEGFDFELPLLGNAVIVDILGEATNTVAAHLHLAPVGVVNLHLEVSDFRWSNRQELVRADAEATMAELPGDRVEVFDLALETIDKNEVVAAAMHLGKLNFHLAYSFRFTKSPRPSARTLCAL
jgi:hypothetical protein